MPAKKKTPAARKATRKKTAAKKSVAKKKAAPKKKSAARKKAATPDTTIIAHADIGFGNQLYIRGEGGGLSWDQGIPMKCNHSGEWAWSTTSSKSGIVFIFLINDRIWAMGEDLTVPAGGRSVSTPHF